LPGFSPEKEPEKNMRNDDPRHAWIDARPSATQYFRVERIDAEKARHLNRSALLVWLYVGMQVSGRRDAWRIGGQEILEWTGISRSQMYEALTALRSAGLIRTVCDRCADPSGFYGPEHGFCKQHQRSTLRHELI